MSGAGVSFQHYGDTLMRSPSTWVWLIAAALGVASCIRLAYLWGQPGADWVNLGLMAVTSWILIGCVLDLALTGPMAGHFTNLFDWQLAAAGSILFPAGYWPATRLSARLFIQRKNTGRFV